MPRKGTAAFSLTTAGAMPPAMPRPKAASFSELPLAIMTALATHLVMSFTQALTH
jgi:hypothetical protein